MVHISLNIVAEGRPLHAFPFYFQMDSFKEFSNMIRRDAFTLACWASDNWVSKYKLYCYIHVHEDTVNDSYWEWDFAIKCENIREFKPYLNLQKEEVDALRIEKNREEKLEDLLNFSGNSNNS